MNRYVVLLALCVSETVHGWPEVNGGRSGGRETDQSGSDEGEELHFGQIGLRFFRDSLF